jgi:hypothetical protein
MLPDEDSNLDKQNQNLSYYHYTIGQLFPFKGMQKYNTGFIPPNWILWQWQMPLFSDFPGFFKIPGQPVKYAQERDQDIQP